MKIWHYIIQQLGHVLEPHELVPARNFPRGHSFFQFCSHEGMFWIYAKSQFKLDSLEMLLVLCGDQVFLTQEKKPYYNNALLKLTFSL